MFKLFLRGLVATIFVTISFQVYGQEPLERYIQEGLRNNLALQQKNISLERAVYALKTANSYFLSSISFSSGYTHGKGGRAIDLPVGDMLNPVYATLNQLTESQGFPQIKNVRQSFFPSNFLDAHVRTALPLLNTDLLLNKKIEQDQFLLQEFEVKVLELVKDIKISCYNYLSALEAVRIYSSALELVERNLLVNQSLLKNGKGLHAAVLRAQSELEQVKAERLEAQNQLINGRRYGILISF